MAFHIIPEHCGPGEITCPSFILKGEDSGGAGLQGVEQSGQRVPHPPGRGQVRPDMAALLSEAGLVFPGAPPAPGGAGVARVQPCRP